jgi:hypothetical protein
MHKNATKCNETLSKWCKNKHGASKIIDTFETYQGLPAVAPPGDSGLPDCVAPGSGGFGLDLATGFLAVRG